jgi:hypothetical protein
MSGTSPNFEDWRELTAIEIKNIACLMQGFDPRAIADVAVRDPDDPTSPYGVSPDTSWEVGLLISAVLTHDLMSVPGDITNPTGDTRIVRTSLISWLRPLGRYDFLADGLSLPVSTHQQTKQVPQSRPAKTSRGVASTPTDSQPDRPSFSMTRAAMIARHQASWPTIAADMKEAASNGLSQAKAGARDWIESIALDWARSKGKLVVPTNSNTLASSMQNLVGRKHSIDD